MSLNCFWRPSILCASSSLWIWAKNSDTSTAASESSLHWAPTCKFSENLLDRHSSGVGEAVGSVRCYHMVCGIYGSLNPHTASLLLHRTRKLSNEGKHTALTVSTGAHCWSHTHQILAGHRKSTDTGDWLESQGLVAGATEATGLELQQPWALNSNLTDYKGTWEVNQNLQKSEELPPHHPAMKYLNNHN